MDSSFDICFPSLHQIPIDITAGWAASSVGTRPPGAMWVKFIAQGSNKNTKVYSQTRNRTHNLLIVRPMPWPLGYAALTHTHTHTHTRIHARTHARTHTRTHTHTWMYARMHACTHAHTHTYTYTHTHTHTHIVHTCACNAQYKRHNDYWWWV